MNLNRNWWKPLVIFGVALLYRIKDVWVNYPFWVDEFSTAAQAKLFLRYGLGVFHQPGIYFEFQNISTHALVALFFRLLGPSPFSARLPMVFIGAFVPVLVWYVGKVVWKDERIAAVAALLTTFSYFEITWSRQARGYVIQQVVLLLTVLLYAKLIAARSSRQRTIFAVCLLCTIGLGIVTHVTYVLVLGILFLHAAFLFGKKFIKNKRLLFFLSLVIAVVALIAWQTGMAYQVVRNILFTFHQGFPNNFWYYHAFLWREYGLITFLGLFGLILSWPERKSLMSIFGGIFLAFIFFFSFLFDPYDSRYLLPIFPILFLGTAKTLVLLTDAVTANIHLQKPKWLLKSLPIFLTLLIVANGYKFVLKPRSFYSVNHDMREIALIDYDQVYGLIKQKGELEKGQTAVIDTWADRMEWYLGAHFQPGYFLRWPKGEKDLLKQTPYVQNQAGEKILPDRQNMRVIADLSDLQLAMSKYPKGFIWIDDSTLSADIIQYAQQHLTKELYLDHYPLDDNPYSIWPGTLYSWGFGNQKK